MSFAHESITGIAHSLPRELRNWRRDTHGTPTFEMFQLLIGMRVEKLVAALREFGGDKHAVEVQSAYDELARVVLTIQGRINATARRSSAARFERLLISSGAKAIERFEAACNCADIELESGSIDTAKIIRAGRGSVGAKDHPNVKAANKSTSDEVRARAEAAFAEYVKLKAAKDWHGSESRKQLAKDHGFSSAQILTNAFWRYRLSRRIS